MERGVGVTSRKKGRKENGVDECSRRVELESGVGRWSRRPEQKGRKEGRKEGGVGDWSRKEEERWCRREE